MVRGAERRALGVRYRHLADMNDCSSFERMKRRWAFPVFAVMTAILLLADSRSPSVFPSTASLYKVSKILFRLSFLLLLSILGRILRMRFISYFFTYCYNSVSINACVNNCYCLLYYPFCFFPNKKALTNGVSAFINILSAYLHT
jgi:hypothetical protein